MIEEICSDELTNGTLVNAVSFEDKHYVTGFFSHICGESSSYIAEWDGDQWMPTTWELTDPGHALRVIDDQLYVARYEESIDSNWLYVFDGATLDKMGTGVYLTTASGFSNLSNIYDVSSFEQNLVICGEFDRAGQNEISGIAQWVDGEWQPLGTGLAGNILNTAPVLFPHQLLVWEDHLYVAGNFRMAGGVEVNGIARWDGSEWTAMGAGFNSTVYGLGVFNGELYAGGDFTASGNTSLSRIAKWDGMEWVSPGFGFTGITSNDYTFVHTIQEIEGQLYIAGGLKQLVLDDGTTLACGGVIGFDGQNFETFDGGVANNDIEAILKVDDELLVGGGVFGSGYAGRIDLITSTESIPLDKDVVCYPNPVSDYIKWTSRQNTVIKKVYLNNAQGIQISQFTGEIIQQQLDVSNLPGGYYCLVFEWADGSLSRESFLKL